MSELAAMETEIDLAYKMGAGRYIQACGAIEKLGSEVMAIGKKAYLLAGATAFEKIGACALKALETEGIDCICEIYEDTCCQEHAQQVAQKIRLGLYHVIIGIGGGVILDLAKLTARIADVPIIAIPTSSATCAAYTPLSVVYTPEGKTRGTWYFPLEVRAVIVDMDVVSRQPARLMAAGIIDAMAKWVEVRHHLKSQQKNNAEDFELAAIVAQHIYQRLLNQGLTGYTDCQNGKSSQALSNAVFASIVGAGIVSGIARGQYQSALAHAIYEWTRTNFLNEAAPFLHGEIVGVGLFIQAAYNGDVQIASQLKRLMKEMHMPLSFEAIGIDMTATHKKMLFDFLAATRFVENTPAAHLNLMQAININSD